MSQNCGSYENHTSSLHLAHLAGDSGATHSGGGSRSPLRLAGQHPVPFPADLLPPSLASGETTFGVKWLFLLEDVIAGPSELVCQGLGGYYIVCFRFLPVEKALGFFVKTPRKISCFDKVPDQIGITVPLVFLATLWLGATDLKLALSDSLLGRN
ncbi:hypothetical protein [Ectopseudomonas mendocina]|uniref:hypothetical protein n=1 Tax=Ectopseudomonas mendocina TaxID=300 RepID=UPI00376EACA6